MTRLALGIEYDGACFLGWQTQPGGGTVQDALEAALTAVAAAPVSVICAGRTDRGVHARGQVVHFDTDSVRPEYAWVRGTNALLPESIAVLWSKRMGADFHARYSALSRTYRYLLINRPVRPAMGARNAGWCHAPLDVDAMRAAGRYFTGEHDFSAFRSSECQAKSPVRTIHDLTIETAGARIVFTLRANAFLHHMVRNIVGTLIYVGKGKHPPHWVAELLDARDRSLAAPTFAPEGLCLERVEYGPQWDLPDTEVTARRLMAPSV